MQHLRRQQNLAFEVVVRIRFERHDRMRLLCLFSIFLLTGCGESLDPRVLELRQKFVVEKPPGNERPVPDIRSDLKSGKLSPSTPFAIRARINAGEIPPFAEGKAAFIVTDATGHDGDEAHNPHECPFCKRDIKSVIAQVERHGRQTAQP